jgi:hypothetical protein
VSLLDVSSASLLLETAVWREDADIGPARVREREVTELELAREGVGLNLAETVGGLAGYVLGELALSESHELGHGLLKAARPDEACPEDRHPHDLASREVAGAGEAGTESEARG